jgi:hypothetical protein
VPLDGHRGDYDTQPGWFSNSLWGGPGGSDGDAFNVRHIRAQTMQPAPGNTMTLGWSWRERSIEPGALVIALPEPDDVQRYVRSIWE